MSTMVIGVLLVVTYIGMIAYLIKGGNPTITMLVMGIIWSVLGGYGVNALVDNLFAGTIKKYALTIVIILFGAWFAQIIVQRKIASSMIRTAVELGGDRPAVVVVLIILVTAFLFISLFSVGPTIAVGVVILPIMLSMGVSPAIASASMTLAIGVAYLVNFSQYTAIRGMFPEGVIPEQFGAPFLPYGYIVFAAGVLISAVGIVIAMKLTGKSHSWCAALSSVDPEPDERVRWFAYLTPVVPVILVIFLKWDIFPAFLAGIGYALITTWKKGTKAFGVLTRTFSDGLSDSGGMVLYLLCTFTFADAAKLVVPILQELLGWALPTTTLQLAIVCAICAPLVVYRGPMAVFGAGIAIYTSLISAGQIPTTFIWLIAITISSVHSSIDPTQSVVVWVNSFTKVKPIDFLKVALPIGWVYGAVAVIICFAMHG